MMHGQKNIKLRK